MEAFLFGAGASHSYSQSPTGVRPPLARGFFQAYHDLDISGDRYVLVGAIVNYVRDTRGVDPFKFGDWKENIEDFLTEIDERIGDPERALSLAIDKRFHYARAYSEMIFLFATVLNEIQNGPVCANYSKLVRSLTRDDVLITFNWDTLLDRALHEGGRWHPVDGYGVNFVKSFDNGWKDIEAQSPTQNVLLKLHGSTNWLMPYFSLHFQKGIRTFTNPAVDPLTRPMFCFINSDSTYETYENRSRAGYAPFSYYYYPPDIPIAAGDRPGYKLISVISAPDLSEHAKTTIGGYPYSSMPLVIAPVRHKEYGLMGNALDGLWQRASTALRECQRLTIIGYSFPPTDIRAWQLLDQACAQRKSALPLTIVSPSADDLARRMIERLGNQIAVTPENGTFNRYLARR